MMHRIYIMLCHPVRWMDYVLWWLFYLVYTLSLSLTLVHPWFLRVRSLKPFFQFPFLAFIHLRPFTLGIQQLQLSLIYFNLESARFHWLYNTPVTSANFARFSNFVIFAFAWNKAPACFCPLSIRIWLLLRFLWGGGNVRRSLVGGGRGKDSCAPRAPWSHMYFIFNGVFVFFSVNFRKFWREI